MIVITGAAGFIGSQVALHLNGQKEKLLLVDRDPLFKERPYVQSLNMQSTVNAHPDFLAGLHALKGVSWIIHLGAITNTAETDAAELEKWNVGYTKAIWNYATEHKVNLVYASSAATYGAGEQGFGDAHENVAKLKPLNLYGKSKNDFDLFALSAIATPPLWYGLKFFNVYGPNENHKGRMASAVWHGYNEINKTGSMTLFRSHHPAVRDGDQARDFIYVGDVLRVIDFLRAKTPESGIYNLGTGHPGTFMELAQCLFKELSKPVKINWVSTPEEFRAAYQYRTQADISKLRKVGYADPMTPFGSGVSKYVQFLKSQSHP